MRRAFAALAGRSDSEPNDLDLGVRGAERHTGEVDDVRIWNRCLTAEEVAALVRNWPLSRHQRRTS